MEAYIKSSRAYHIEKRFGAVKRIFLKEEAPANPFIKFENCAVKINDSTQS